ncbi:Fc.00g014970.m01.CDS01 [Cosmosporella sp. VM-42]
MPPKKAAPTADGESPTGLTDGELRFIKADSVANSLGLKDSKCAKERFRQMSVRHGWQVSGGGTASPRKPKASSAGGIAKKPRTPRKKAKKDEDEDEDKTEVKQQVKEEVKEEQEDSEMTEAEA